MLRNNRTETDALIAMVPPGEADYRGMILEENRSVDSRIGIRVGPGISGVLRGHASQGVERPLWDQGSSLRIHPAEVVRHAWAFIEGHRARGVPCTLKHFPGHGSAVDHSHMDLVDVTPTWSRVELEPYAELIAAGACDAVMTAHVFNRAIDPDFPATLSRAAIDGMLRGELDFDRVVISDDMQMGAVANHYGFEIAIERALLAGIDIIILANNTLYQEDAVSRACTCIRRLLDDGKIDEARIDASCARIARLKGDSV